MVEYKVGDMIEIVKTENPNGEYFFGGDISGMSLKLKGRIETVSPFDLNGMHEQRIIAYFSEIEDNWELLSTEIRKIAQTPKLDELEQKWNKQ